MGLAGAGTGRVHKEELLPDCEDWPAGHSTSASTTRLGLPIQASRTGQHPSFFPAATRPPAKSFLPFLGFAQTTGVRHQASSKVLPSFPWFCTNHRCPLGYQKSPSFVFLVLHKPQVSTTRPPAKPFLRFAQTTGVHH